MQFLVQNAVAADNAHRSAIPVHIKSQAALGELLSVSRESVVRALRKLRENAVITTHHGVVTIRNLDALMGSQLAETPDEPTRSQHQ